MIEPEPEPCPDCGLPLLEVGYDDEVKGFRVTCPRCGCVGPVALSPETAIIKWNSRIYWGGGS